MATQRIKTDLFSFKTFRSPDKIALIDKNEFCIQHPDFTKSRFNQCPVPNFEKDSQKSINDFINSFNSSSSYKEIRAINPEIYDFSSQLIQQIKNDSSKKQFDFKLPSPLKKEILYNVWDELFVQVVSQKSVTARQACVNLIISQHYLKNAKTFDLNDLSKLVIEIPKQVIDCCIPVRYSKCGGKLFGVHNLGIQEYRKVEQTLCCYVPGEVSHIENIMAREYKEKSTRNLLRTEYSTEFTFETEIENSNDTTTTERNELSKEIAKELQKDKSLNISGSVSVTKDTKILGNVSANASTSYNSSTSSSQSNKEALIYAKEITERALEKVIQKTSEKRTYKMTKEFEENNKHGFDNRIGNEHVTGVYRWVDKIYNNQLVSYGRRLLFEISVPTPAKMYKMAMQWKKNKAETEQNTLTPPQNLAYFKINSSNDIGNDNVSSIASYYGVKIDSYESTEKIISVDIPHTEVKHDGDENSIVQPNIVIPDGFVAVSIEGEGYVNYHTPIGSAFIEFIFGGIVSKWGDWSDAGTNNFNYDFLFIPNRVGSISFVVKYRRTTSFGGGFRIKCISDPALLKKWQEETFLVLQTAYQDKLDKYNKELKIQKVAQEAADQKGSEANNNPAFNRLIEERELKRLCIELMGKPFCYDLGKNFCDCKTYVCNNNCDNIEATIPEVIQNESLEKYTEFIKFFETAFHWEILSYIFYPYYYNSKCQWSELIQTKNDDPIFEAFLQSGMARILVPVRPQFEKAVMWYLETGEIYTEGTLVPETEDDKYNSLLKELENPDISIEVDKPWKTRIPSSLTIIQAESTYLKGEKGLPCCEDEEKLFDSRNDLLGINKTKK